MTENRNPNRQHLPKAIKLGGPTLLSPTLMRNHRFLVHENAKLLMEVCSQNTDINQIVSSAGTPAQRLAALRSSTRFQDLVSTIAKRESQGHRFRPEHRCTDRSIEFDMVRPYFVVLQHHAREQQEEVQRLIRSLAAWRRRRLLQHLEHWHRTVVESLFDTLATAFDKWNCYRRAKEHSRVLEERLTVLRRSLRLSALELYLHWWSLIIDISRNVRRSLLASTFHALRAGVKVCAWTRAAKRRSACFCSAIILMWSFHQLHERASDLRRYRCAAELKLVRVWDEVLVRQVLRFWRQSIALSQLVRRHARMRRTRTLPACWIEWRRRCIHAKAALLAVARRHSKMRCRALASALRRWRVCSKLAWWARQRQQARLEQCMQRWREWSAAAAWKQHAICNARNLFWSRGQPRLLGACFAALRALLLRLRRARATVLVLERTRLHQFAREAARRLMAAWAATARAFRAAVNLRMRVLERWAVRVSSAKLRRWQLNALFGVRRRALRATAMLRAAAWCWHAWRGDCDKRRQLRSEAEAVAAAEEAKEEMVALCHTRTRLRALLMRAKAQHTEHLALAPKHAVRAMAAVGELVGRQDTNGGGANDKNEFVGGVVQQEPLGAHKEHPHELVHEETDAQEWVKTIETQQRRRSSDSNASGQRHEGGGCLGGKAREPAALSEGRCKGVVSSSGGTCKVEVEHMPAAEREWNGSDEEQVAGERHQNSRDERHRKWEEQLRGWEEVERQREAVVTQARQRLAKERDTGCRRRHALVREDGHADGEGEGGDSAQSERGDGGLDGRRFGWVLRAALDAVGRSSGSWRSSGEAVARRRGEETDEGEEDEEQEQRQVEGDGKTRSLQQQAVAEGKVCEEELGYCDGVLKPERAHVETRFVWWWEDDDFDDSPPSPSSLHVDAAARPCTRARASRCGSAAAGRGEGAASSARARARSSSRSGCARAWPASKSTCGATGEMEEEGDEEQILEEALACLSSSGTRGAALVAEVRIEEGEEEEEEEEANVADTILEALQGSRHVLGNTAPTPPSRRLRYRHEGTAAQRQGSEGKGGVLLHQDIAALRGDACADTRGHGLASQRRGAEPTEARGKSGDDRGGSTEVEALMATAGPGREARQRVRAALVCAGASPELTATVLTAGYRGPRPAMLSQQASHVRGEIDGGQRREEMEVKVPGEACGVNEWRRNPHVRKWGSSAGGHRYLRLLDEGVEEEMVALKERCKNETGRGGGELESRRRETTSDGGRGDAKRREAYTMMREHVWVSPPGSPFSSPTSSPRSLPPLSSAQTMALAVSSTRVPRGPGYCDAVCASTHDGSSEGDRTELAAADRGVRATKAGQLRLKMEEALHRRVLLLWRAPCLARKASISTWRQGQVEMLDATR